MALTVYTDGSCVGGIGGYGFVVLENETIIHQQNGKIEKSTNQIAELTAILEALKYLSEWVPDRAAVIKTDSKYAMDSLTVWIKKWKINGYKTANGKDIKNKDLILSCYNLLTDKITFEHVRAHTGIVYNEMADRLANAGREL